MSNNHYRWDGLALLIVMLSVTSLGVNAETLHYWRFGIGSMNGSLPASGLFDEVRLSNTAYKNCCSMRRPYLERLY